MYYLPTQEELDTTMYIFKKFNVNANPYYPKFNKNLKFKVNAKPFYPKLTKIIKQFVPVVKGF